MIDTYVNPQKSECKVYKQYADELSVDGKERACLEKTLEASEGDAHMTNLNGGRRSARLAQRLTSLRHFVAAKEGARG
jgi:hypothetical protein